MERYPAAPRGDVRRLRMVSQQFSSLSALGALLRWLMEGRILVVGPAKVCLDTPVYDKKKKERGDLEWILFDKLVTCCSPTHSSHKK